MFGDMFGPMEEMQKAMQEKLSQVQVTGEAGDGAVKAVANGLRMLVDISIDKAQVDLTDTEELQDLIVIAVNRAMEAAAEEEAKASQDMIKDIMPPGMSGLGNLFGGQ